jgi:hypothetical protein
LARVRNVHRRNARQRNPAAQQRELIAVVLADQVERLAVEDRGLVLRPAPLSLLRRLDEVAQSPLRLARVSPVAG